MGEMIIVQNTYDFSIAKNDYNKVGVLLVLMLVPHLVSADKRDRLGVSVSSLGTVSKFNGKMEPFTHARKVVRNEKSFVHYDVVSQAFTDLDIASSDESGRK